MSEEAAMLDGLARAFRGWGADEAQARVMAAQVVRRARQLAAEKGIPEVDALAELLAKIAAGRRGDYPGTTVG